MMADKNDPWEKFRVLMSDKKNVEYLEHLLDKNYSHSGWKDLKMRKLRRAG